MAVPAAMTEAVTMPALVIAVRYGNVCVMSGY